MCEQDKRQRYFSLAQPFILAHSFYSHGLWKNSIHNWIPTGWIFKFDSLKIQCESISVNIKCDQTFSVIVAGNSYCYIQCWLKTWSNCKVRFIQMTFHGAFSLTNVIKCVCTIRDKHHSKTQNLALTFSKLMIFLRSVKFKVIFWRGRDWDFLVETAEVQLFKM